MRRLTKRERIIFILCVLFVLAYVSIHWILTPLWENVEVLDSQILAKEMRLKKNQDLIRNALRKEFEYKDFLAGFRQTVSDEQAMSTILSEIESVATGLGVKIADMKPKKVRNVDFYNQFSVSLAVDEELPKITHFLYNLQNRPHLFLIEEFSLNQSSLRSTQLRCQLVLSRILVP